MVGGGSEGRVRGVQMYRHIPYHSKRHKQFKPEHKVFILHQNFATALCYVLVYIYIFNHGENTQMIHDSSPDFYKTQLAKRTFPFLPSLDAIVVRGTEIRDDMCCQHHLSQSPHALFCRQQKKFSFNKLKSTLARFLRRGTNKNNKKQKRNAVYQWCLSNRRKTDPTLSLQSLQTCCGEWCLHDNNFWLSVPKSWWTPKIHVQGQKRGTVSNTEHETVVKSLRVHCTSNYFLWWRSGLSMTQNTTSPQNNAHKLLKPKFLPAETDRRFAWISLAILICSKCLVLISSNLSWNPLINRIEQKANGVAGFLKR